MNIDEIRASMEAHTDTTRVLGEVVNGTYHLDTYRHAEVISHEKQKVLAGDGIQWGRDIDIGFLHGAASSYDISANIKDYVIVSIPIVTADIPNRNLQAFPFEECTYYDPYFGKFVYSTFVGKPTYIDHANDKPLQAKGVIFDAVMEPVPEWGVWKINILAGYCREKDPVLTKAIRNGTRNSYSMGALVSKFVCSVCSGVSCNCGNKYRSEAFLVKGDNRLDKPKLVYSQCVGVNYFECSSVGVPADPTSWSDKIWTAT